MRKGLPSNSKGGGRSVWGLIKESGGFLEGVSRRKEKRAFLKKKGIKRGSMKIGANCYMPK